MAINKKLIHFDSKDSFMSALEGTLPQGGAADADHGQLHDYSIVFVKESKEIWTHDNLYKSVNWSVLGEEGWEPSPTIVKVLNSEY